jgi:hypothetical protein
MGHPTVSRTRSRNKIISSPTSGGRTFVSRRPRYDELGSRTGSGEILPLLARFIRQRAESLHRRGVLSISLEVNRGLLSWDPFKNRIYWTSSLEFERLEVLELGYYTLRAFQESWDTETKDSTMGRFLGSLFPQDELQRTSGGVEVALIEHLESLDVLGGSSKNLNSYRF